MTKTLRAASLLILFGLLIEGFTLRWSSPVAFLVFLGAGGLLMLTGIIIYLLALISPAAASGDLYPPEY